MSNAEPANAEQPAAAPCPAVAEALRVYKAIPELGRLRDDVLFGEVWAHPDLSQRDRSLVTCAVLATLGRQDELAVHVKRAAANGITADELRGMAVQIAFYAGWPTGIGLGRAALAILEGDA